MEKPLKKIALARQMRKALTEPEYLLWERLKSRGDGLVFRRQHPVGWYILDFYCAKAGLCVEVDGAGHGDMEAHDKRRDAWLASKRIYVYRIPAAEV